MPKAAKSNNAKREHPYEGKSDELPKKKRAYPVKVFKPATPIDVVVDAEVDSKLEGVVLSSYKTKGGLCASLHDPSVGERTLLRFVLGDGASLTRPFTYNPTYKSWWAPVTMDDEVLDGLMGAVYAVAMADESIAGVDEIDMSVSEDSSGVKSFVVNARDKAVYDLLPDKLSAEGGELPAENMVIGINFRLKDGLLKASYKLLGYDVEE